MEIVKTLSDKGALECAGYLAEPFEKPAEVVGKGGQAGRALRGSSAEEGRGAG